MDDGGEPRSVLERSESGGPALEVRVNEGLLAHELRDELLLEELELTLVLALAGDAGEVA